MIACASCGADNRAGFKFCGAGGAPLHELAPPRDVRKTVTVLFCDIVGSTSSVEMALELYERKGVVPGVERARRLLVDAASTSSQCAPPGSDPGQTRVRAGSERGQTRTATER